MSETVATPFGHIPKKTAIIGGIGVVVGGVLYFRWQASKKAAATAASGANTGIDPATGYAYGSPEDAAALTNQAAYITPVGTGIGGVSNVPSGGTGLPPGFSSNAQWTQYVITYLETNGLVSDGGASMLATLGKYTTGAHIDPGSDDESRVNQAISIAGYPPVSGVNGYPPHLNEGSTPPPTNNPPPSGNPPPPTQKQPIHTHVLDGKSVDELVGFWHISRQNLWDWNPGLQAHVLKYKAGKGYGDWPGAIDALNVGPNGYDAIVGWN